MLKITLKLLIRFSLISQRLQHLLQLHLSLIQCPFPTRYPLSFLFQQILLIFQIFIQSLILRLELIEFIQVMAILRLHLLSLLDLHVQISL